MNVPRRVLSGLILATAVTAVVTARQQRGLDFGASAFEGYIELLRQTAGIPGRSGVLSQDGSLVWERGLGFADVEARIPARPDTPYVIGDLTEALTAVLVLQCDERRRVDIKREINNYGGEVSNDRALVRHVLSHTSTSSGNFKYEPASYAQLTGVVEYCSHQPFRKTMALDLLDRLAMARSVPGRDLATAGTVPADMFEKAHFDHYRHILESLAVPYKVDKKLHPTRTELAPEGINAATGLVSTVRDLAQFDFALDNGTLLRETTLAEAWSAVLAPGGAPQPTGLGWFVQNYRGVPLVWQYGMVPNAYSAMVLKIPSRRVTMILLANSDGLVNSFQLEAGDVTRSPFASVLLRMLL